MPFITIIEGAVALLHTKGVYRQVNIYQRGSSLYAKWGTGFVRLAAGGATSATNVRWAEIDTAEAGAWREVAHAVEFIPAVRVEVAAE